MSEKFLTISIISIKYANEEVEKTGSEKEKYGKSLLVLAEQAARKWHI